MSNTSKFGRFLALCYLIFMVPIAHSKESQTVVADGIGVKLDEAIKNSAENAMMQLVGSFVDAEKSVEKLVEIRGAVKEQTKSISSRMSEYSQGTIENIEVLLSENDGGLYRVTCKVTVRTEVFQAYLRRTALAEREVKQGLFAKVQATREQGVDLGEIIIGRVIQDIYALKVVKLSAGDADVIRDPKLESSARRILKSSQDETLIRIPISAKIDPQFLTNAFNTLEKTALAGYKGGQVASYLANRESQNSMKFWLVFADFVGSGDKRGMRPFDSSNGWAWRADLSENIAELEDLKLYVFPESKVNDLCSAADAIVPSSTLRLHWDVPSLTLRVLDSTKNEVLSTVLVDSGPGAFFGNDLVASSRGFLFREPWSSNYGSEQALTFLRYSSDTTFDMKDCIYGIDTASEFSVILKLTDDELSKAASIEVSLER